MADWLQAESNRRFHPCRESRASSWFQTAFASSRAPDSKGVTQRTFVQHHQGVRSRKWQDVVCRYPYAGFVVYRATHLPSNSRNLAMREDYSTTSPIRNGLWMERTTQDP